MPKANHIKPAIGQEYWTITKSGTLIKTVNEYSKSDLFNIMFSLCWDGMHIDVDDKEHAIRDIKELEDIYRVQT